MRLSKRDTPNLWKRIPVRKSAKFLGVTFDSNLKFTEYIQNIANRCHKRINMLRCLSGTQWGAAPDYLLILYKTLILSIIDYGSIVYDIAPAKVLNSLDQIQYLAPKIITGAMKGTAISTLQVATGTLPLHLRRKELQINYYLSVMAVPQHPGQDIFKDHWKNHYGKYSRNRNTLYNKLVSI